MPKEEFLGTVEFTVTAGMVPWGDPGEYVLSAKGTANALDENGAEETAGEITLKLIRATEAVNHDENLFDVCDADSATLEAMYAAMFDVKGEPKEELDIEPGWNNILFVEAMAAEPEFRETTVAVQVIETAIATFCSDGLAVAVEDALDFSIDEWRQLGFKRIGDTGFVFRDNLRLNPYELEPSDDD